MCVVVVVVCFVLGCVCLFLVYVYDGLVLFVFVACVVILFVCFVFAVVCLFFDGCIIFCFSLNITRCSCNDGLVLFVLLLLCFVSCCVLRCVCCLVCVWCVWYFCFCWAEQGVLQWWVGVVCACCLLFVSIIAFVCVLLFLFVLLVVVDVFVFV